MARNAPARIRAPRLSFFPKPRPPPWEAPRAESLGVVKASRGKPGACERKPPSPPQDVARKIRNGPRPLGRPEIPG
jgi:hypothetical protein